MNETVMVYNMSGSGLTGITNLSTQTGSLGTIIGSAFLIGMLLSVVLSLHSWNTRGWLYKTIKWLLQNVGENFVYGVATCGIVGGIYYVGEQLGKFGQSNPHLLTDIAWFGVITIAGIAFVSLVGYATKPIWNFAYSYATAKKRR